MEPPSRQNHEEDAMRARKTVYVGVRLPAPMVEQMDALAAKLEAANPDYRTSRSDIIRLSLASTIAGASGSASPMTSGVFEPA